MSRLIPTFGWLAIGFALFSAAGLVALQPRPASAQTVEQFSASLSGAGATPATSSTATGAVTFAWDNSVAGGVLSWTAKVPSIQNATAVRVVGRDRDGALVKNADGSQAAPLLLFTAPAAGPVGVIDASGTTSLSQVGRALGGIADQAAVRAALISSQVIVEVTTTAFPNGEIGGRTRLGAPAAAAATPAATAPAPVAGPGTFAAAPIFGASGLASAVFLGGSFDQLEATARSSGATGVWFQDGSGAFNLLIIGGPAFLNDVVKAKFPRGFAGATAMTLTGAAPAAPAPAPASTPSSGASASTPFIVAYSATAVPALQDARVRWALMLTTSQPINWTPPEPATYNVPNSVEALKLMAAAGYADSSLRALTITLSVPNNAAAQGAAAALAQDWERTLGIRVLRVEGSSPTAPALLSITSFTSTPR